MCGNGGICIERSMPASSGDPVSTALHMSLAGNKCSTLKKDDLDTKIVASARRVLLTEIPYEAAGSYSATVLDSLKSKYIVLNANLCDSKVEVKVKSELRNSPSKDFSQGTVINSNVCDSKIEVKGKNEPKDSSCKDYSPKKVKTDTTLPTPKRILYPAEAIQLGWQNTTPVGSGMINMGNTCYLNSTLQALFHVPAFVNWILNDKIHSSKCGLLNGTGHNECLICTVMKTLQFSQRNSGTAIKPVQIYSKLKLICKHLVHGHQEDAHEFLRYLIESMERSYLNIVQGTKLDSYSKETTPLNQIFGGYLRTEVTCLECRHVSTTFQHFQDLLLDIRTVGSVEDALDAYFGREQLGEGEEAYRCEQCHRRVAATKKFSIQKAPNVLCMQLKRFGIMGGKISKHVSLKQKLNLSKFMHPSTSTKGDLTYRLVSMISHIGPSASCGHYTAMASSSSGGFYLFDDNLVRQVQLQTVLNTNAYVIMYELEPSSVLRPAKSSSIVSVSASNGISNKTIQNGVSQSPLSIHKQALILSPSKAERATPLSSSSSSSSSSTSSPPLSVPSSSSVSSSSTLNSSPKHSKMMNGGLCSPSKSLVPYTPNESSDSESENASSYRSTKKLGMSSNVSKEQKNGIITSVNGVAKDVLQKSQSLFTNGSKNNPAKDSSSSLLKLNLSPSSTSTSNLFSPSKSSSSSSCSNGAVMKKEKISLPAVTTACRTPSKKVIEEPPSLIVNGWHVSESSLNSPNSSSCCSSSSNTSVGCAVGQWNITDVTKSRSHEKPETITTDTKSSSSSNSLPVESGNKTNGNINSCNSDGRIGNNSSSCNSLSGNSNSREWNNSGVNGGSTSSNGKMWDGSRNSETVNELLKMSHRGYAGSNVNTWNGDKSEVEKDVESEKQEQKKRSYNNLYDEDFDRGKAKKAKNYNTYSSSLKNDCNSNGKRFNPFQDHQNRKNLSWYGNNNNNNNSGNNMKRPFLYRKYSMENRYHEIRHVYRNQNGYNNWRH